MSAKNPTREIYFFKHDSKPMVYVLMSLKISKDDFYDMFEHAQEITEEESDLLVMHNKYEVVYVGDDDVIDKYFTPATAPN